STNPPTPLIATIAPSAIFAAAARIAASPSATISRRVARRTRGPHAGHALGSAWNRRLAGASYSRMHASHIANTDIVVARRSYGTSRTIVNRGPHAVQLVNGYR